jgi:RNA polymerase sigma-70 factor (ECF subfamily)
MTPSIVFIIEAYFWSRAVSLPNRQASLRDSNAIFLMAGFGDGGMAPVFPSRMAQFQEGKEIDQNVQKKAIELQYDELRSFLRRYLSCVGLEPQEAEDIIQETFLKLFEGLAGGMEVTNLRGWIFRVAHNLTVNLHKEATKLLSTEAEEVAQFLKSRIDARLNPEEVVLQKERLAHLVSGVSRLSPQQRQALHLRAEGLLYREIGVVLGVNTQRVGKVIQEALMHLGGEL